MFRSQIVLIVLYTIAVFASTSSLNGQSKQTETEITNERVIRRQYQLLNQGDFQGAAQDFAETSKHQGQVVSRENRLRVLRDIYTTFPDYKLNIVDLVASGDDVIIRAVASGTHKGIQQMAVNGNLLIGATPTNKRFEAQHIHWYKLRDGKIVEHFATRDDIGMTRQLGLLPPTGLPKSN
jgi:predicted ester cyclase